MRQARLEESWYQTAALLAMLYNVNRDKGSIAKRPDDFHPFRIAANRRVRLTVKPSEVKHLFQRPS